MPLAREQLEAVALSSETGKKSEDLILFNLCRANTRMGRLPAPGAGHGESTAETKQPVFSKPKIARRGREIVLQPV